MKKYPNSKPVWLGASPEYKVACVLNNVYWFCESDSTYRKSSVKSEVPPLLFLSSFFFLIHSIWELPQDSQGEGLFTEQQKPTFLDHSRETGES